MLWDVVLHCLINVQLLGDWSLHLIHTITFILILFHVVRDHVEVPHVFNLLKETVVKRTI